MAKKFDDGENSFTRGFFLLLDSEENIGIWDAIPLLLMVFAVLGMIVLGIAAVLSFFGGLKMLVAVFALSLIAFFVRLHVRGTSA